MACDLKRAFLLAAFCAAAAPALANELVCEPAGFPIVIDRGHSPERPGATSATGQPEFEFNLSLAEVISGHLRAAGFPTDVPPPESGPIRLRAAQANRLRPRLFLSIHHDSVQPVYLQSWSVNGRKQFFSDRFSGWSLFVSRDNVSFDRALVFASGLPDSLLKKGLPFSLHHAEPIPHENRPLLDHSRGIYAFDQLVVLRAAEAPAVLLEAGVIVNREEERRAASPERRVLIADSVVEAARQFCGSLEPTPAASKNLIQTIK
jgi:N-acetylmuramoyl-L-alanine amidase